MSNIKGMLIKVTLSLKTYSAFAAMLRLGERRQSNWCTSISFRDMRDVGRSLTLLNQVAKWM